MVDGSALCDFVLFFTRVGPALICCSEASDSNLYLVSDLESSHPTSNSVLYVRTTLSLTKTAGHLQAGAQPKKDNQ